MPKGAKKKGVGHSIRAQVINFSRASKSSEPRLIAAAGVWSRLIDDSETSFEPINARTRVTMGRGQGRHGLTTVAALVGRASGGSVALREQPRARPMLLADLLHEPVPPPQSPEMLLP